MCGRFTLISSPEAIAERFQLSSLPQLSPRFNVAPSQFVATITRENGQTRQLHPMKWGLIPRWAKDPAIGNRLINARAETLAEKPSFRDALKHRRCLIVADGFYEWQQRDTGKQPYYIHRVDGRPFAFAGLWDEWRSKEGETVTTCTIVTAEANRLMEPIHHRQPVILSPDDYDPWLDPSLTDPAELGTFLVSRDGEGMEAYPVSATVNRPTNDLPECIERLHGDVERSPVNGPGASDPERG